MKLPEWIFLCIASLVDGRAVTATDGSCGSDSGLSCMGSIFGNCCSKNGLCGATPEYCGRDCQADFGICDGPEGTTSQDGTCGGSLGYSCLNSPFGNCCSQFGYCGSGDAYCGDGCRPSHGECGDGSQMARRSPLPVNNTSDGRSAGSRCASKRLIHRPDSRTRSCVRCQGQPGNDQFCGYDIHTNYYDNVPKTCRTVEYTFEITNTTIAPDGIERMALLVNGQMPGPAIEVNWGDTVRVTVVNKMQDNGTSIHFHGVRQHFNNQYDGVPSITQCPIPPGESMTYIWVAESYGTSWWHSHYSIQTWEGVFGPIIIYGPNSPERSYDVDVGAIILQDWSHRTVDSLYPAVEDATPGHVGGAPILDNGLINGRNTWGADGSFNQTGERYMINVTKGKSYLLRVINTSIQSTFRFQIDEHPLTVISTDFTPIAPYSVKLLNINIGQRYDVIVHADQEVGDYWMRSDNQNTCTSILQALDIKGIFSYEGSGGQIPTTKPFMYMADCTDEDASLHKPILQLNVSAPDISWYGDVTIEAPNNLFRWFISGETFFASWDEPTVLGILNSGEPINYSGRLLIESPDEGDWIYVIVESNIPFPHPLHLHGHDFFVLGMGSGFYNNRVPLRLENPSRRDTILMPGAGYLVLAWRVDNPGTWLMHCHVGWHIAMGFAAQVVEMKDQIAETWDDGGCQLEQNCAAWKAWTDAENLVAMDSGV